MRNEKERERERRRIKNGERDQDKHDVASIRKKRKRDGERWHESFKMIERDDMDLRRMRGEIRVVDIQTCSV